MPDKIDDNVKDVEAPLDEEQGQDEGKSGSRRGGLVRLLLLIVPAVLLPASAGAFVAYTQYPEVARTAASFGLDFGLNQEAEEEEPQEYGEFLVLTDIIINPAESDGKRFLLLSIGLESSEPEVLEEVGTKDIVVRDVVLRVMGERTVPELSSIEERQAIKEELRRALNELMDTGEIDRLYFTQFVLQ